MRLTVLRQMAKGVRRAPDEAMDTGGGGDSGEETDEVGDDTEHLPDLATELQRELERLKWFL